MRTLLLLLMAAGCGADLEPAPSAVATTPGGTDVVPEPGGSFYLRTFRPGGLAVDEMTPLILTPRSHDTLVPGVPDT